MEREIVFPPSHRLPDAVLELDGKSLTVADVVAVARARRRVRISAAARQRVRRSRTMVEALLESHAKVYGLTTGFGPLRDVLIEKAEARRLQQNLIRSHAAGVGAPFDEEVVRAALCLRINTLCLGHSGVRELVLDRLVAMLNEDVYAFVPEQGSVGACGDLAPLSHLALALVWDGAGRFLPRSARVGGAQPLAGRRPEEFRPFPESPAERAELAQREGWSEFQPLVLEAKEGLALNNGTTFMSALLALALYDGFFLLRWSEASLALSLEAHQGQPASLDERIHLARPQRHQAAAAARVRAYVEGSQLVGLEWNVARWNEARAELAAAQRSLEESGPVELVPRLRALAGELEALLPRSADGRPDERILAAWRALSGAEQITACAPRSVAAARAAARLALALADAGLPEAAQRLERSAEHLRGVVASSPHVQDDYSLRCFPVVAATAYRALEHALDVVECEINSATDNPLLFPPEPGPGGAEAEDARALAASPERLAACLAGVIGGSNFHGHPIAVVADYLAIALAGVGNMSERRIAHLVDPHHSRGLPAFLARDGGLNSGLMIAQYTAAALVAENKVLGHPASVDSVPTSANAEDYVSMGTLAARKARTIAEHVETILAIELLSGAQALLFRLPLAPAPRVVALQEALARCCAPFREDRALAPAIEAVREWMGTARAQDLLLGLADGRAADPRTTR